MKPGEPAATWRESDGWALARLGAVFAGWVVWLARPNGGAAVLLALTPWLIEVWPLPGRCTKLQRARRMPWAMTAALAGFLLSALVGLWASYDRTGALAVFNIPVGVQKLWGLVLAVLLCEALAGLSTMRALRYGVALLGMVGAATAVLVIVSSQGGGLDLPEFLRDIRPLAATEGPARGPNPNIAAGVLAPLLCLVGGAAVETRTGRGRWAWLWVAGSGVCALCMAMVLVWTFSRGGWLSFGLAAGLVLLWWGLGVLFPQRWRWHTFLLWAGRDILTLVMLGLLPWFRAWVLRLPDVANRAWIYTRAGLLIRDFPFTGVGLGTFALLDASYAELIHVPTLAYAHHIVLDVAVEQGLPGALALVSLWGVAAWQGLWALGRALQAKREVAPGRVMLAAGLLALLVVAVHGMVDDAFGSSGWMPLLFAPVGIIAAARQVGDDRPSWVQRAVGRGLAAVLLAGGAALLVGLGTELPAAWYANLGAVAQAHAELPQYDYLHWNDPSLRQLRQWVNMTTAERYYDYALVYDHDQLTARTRLAQLAMARGAYDAALRHAESAWHAGNGDRVVTMIYSDALVSRGQVERAVELMRGLPRAAMRLQLQLYGHEVAGELQEAAHARAALGLLEAR